jgi:plastocyanin
MRTRHLLAFVAVISLLLGFVMPVTAGGWATVELETPVDRAVAGEEIVLSIAVRQHGQSLVRYDDVQVTATHADTERTVEVMAEPGEMDGYYTATITLPLAGRWNLEAEELEYGFHSSFPTVHVVGADSGNAAAPETAVVTAVKPVEIDIVNTGFSPALIEINAGDTVQWTNRDPIKHEIAFVDLAIDDSGILDGNGTFTFTFNEPGEYTFVCGPHPGMSGKVVVR